MKKRFQLILGALLLTSLVFVAASCSQQSEYKLKEQAITEEQQGRLLAAQPPPSLSYSLEREQLSQRLTRFNVPDKVSYIYLVSFGKVMAFYPIQGKVSSVNSLLTTPDQVVGGAGSSSKVTVSSPDLDGSYGSNGDAIFFFTTEDVYVEWSGNYMLVDEPLQLSTPPEIVYTAPLNEEEE